MSSEEPSGEIKKKIIQRALEELTFDANPGHLQTKIVPSNNEMKDTILILETNETQNSVRK